MVGLQGSPLCVEKAAKHTHVKMLKLVPVKGTFNTIHIFNKSLKVELIYSKRV